MEITAEVNLNRKAAAKDDEESQQRMDELAVALADGNDHWRRRFDRMGSTGADGIDLTRRDGELVRHRRWAVTADPGPALQAFFVDTDVTPSYSVSGRNLHQTRPPFEPRTATLAFTPTSTFDTTGGEGPFLRVELLDAASEIARFRDRVAEMWAYLDENPDKRRDWVTALLGDEEALNALDATANEHEETLWEALFDNVPEALFSGDSAFGPFPADLVVKPDGEVVEAVGFVETDDGYAVARRDISWAVTEVVGQIVSPNILAYRDTALDDLFSPLGESEPDGAELDRERKIDELLALRFTVKPADEREIVEALEAALQPLDEYRLSWIRDP